MSCNCKTNQKLLELANTYGSNGLTRKDKIKLNVRNFFYFLFTVVFSIIVSPFIFIWLMCKGLFGKDKGVHFDKIFKLKVKNVREQQNIQAQD